jgi:peptide deformylase
VTKVIHPIRYFGDPVLRRVARPVTRFDDALGRLVQDMVQTMYEANGIGLAAPQIGVDRRVFVALETGETDTDEEHGQEHDAEPEEDDSPEAKRERWGVIQEHVLVNPMIVARDGVQYGQDGCLSVPGVYVERLQRDFRVRVRYQDVHGHDLEMEAEGRFAHVLQHEYDHLEGVLFFDRLPDDERRDFLEEHRAELADMQRQAKALIKELRRSPIEVAVE